MDALNDLSAPRLDAILRGYQEAREWGSGKSLAEFWAGCARGNWMLWVAGRLGIESKRLAALSREHARIMREDALQPVPVPWQDTDKRFADLVRERLPVVSEQQTAEQRSNT